MDPRDKERLQRNYGKLLDVNYSTISPHLISTFVLTLEMHDEIDCKPTEKKKMEKLISILPSRGGNAMKELIDALKPSHRWIARELQGDENDQSISSGQNNNNNVPETSIAKHVREVSRILERCSRACTHWTFLAHSMNLMPTTVMDIKREMSYSGGHEFALFSLLEAWVTKVGGSRATFSRLISILNKEGMNQCGEDIMNYWTRLPLRGEYSQNRNNEQQAHLERPSRPQYPPCTDV